MQNQKTLNINFVNFGQFRSILALYLFTLGTCLLGFSVYLMLESFGYSSNNLTSWSGQGLFWAFILFFGSLFILFFYDIFIAVCIVRCQIKEGSRERVQYS